MKILKLTGCMIVFCCMLCSAVMADVDADDIAKALPKELDHPYLYFSESDKPAIKQRIEENPAFGDIMKQTLAEANRLLYTPVDPQLPPRTRMPRFEAGDENGSRMQEYTRSAYTLAFTYQMTGEQKYADKAFEFIASVCEQPTWTHPAHEFPVIYDRVWPWNVKDDQVVFSYGQWTDHLVFEIAAVYDWLYDALGKRDRDQIRGALLEKAILTVRGNYEYHWWATAYRCNWCSVVNASLGVAAAALLTEDPQLTDVMAESYNRISKTLDEVKSGGWGEGVSYLDYCFRTSLNYAEVLNRLSGGKYNIYKHPRIDDIVKTILYCQIPPDKSVHFGDAGGHKMSSYLMMNNLMTESGSNEAAWLRDHLGYNEPVNIMGLLKPVATLTPEIPSEPSMYFPNVEWVIMRSDLDNPENVVITAKSGKNDDPHHGHLDSGHFSLYWRGTEFIRDHGSAGYDRAYFDKERWDYPLASSIGHNVVQVNGERQMASKLKNQPWEDYGGRVVEFRPGADRDYAKLDPTGAYPGKQLKRWQRHIVYDKPLTTLVLDEVTASKGAEITVRFHQAETADLRDGYALLKSGDDMMALIPVADAPVTLRPGRHAILMAQRSASLRWVHYFDIVATAGEPVTVIGSIIVPVESESEAVSVLNSIQSSTAGNGAREITFTANGGRHLYSFANGKDGLVLGE